jgi:hypothetical protein
MAARVSAESILSSHFRYSTSLPTRKATRSAWPLDRTTTCTGCNNRSRKGILRHPPNHPWPLFSTWWAAVWKTETFLTPWEAFKQALRLFIPHIPFDEAWYCRHYPDVAAAVKCGLITSAHEHFVSYGFFEGRSPAPHDHWIAP